MMDNQKNVFEFIESGFKLLDFIPFGKKNAIHRRDLSDLAKISDRQVRAIIKSLAKDYGVIANYETGGYFRAETVGEINDALMIERERVIAIQHTIRDLEKYKRGLSS